MRDEGLKFPSLCRVLHVFLAGGREVGNFMGDSKFGRVLQPGGTGQGLLIHYDQT